MAPGELHGVDMEESQVELARLVAGSQGLSNAFFHVADAVDLPFEDGSFDVAHCHNVLMHIPDTAAVLGEIRRVLKPGGIIGCREMIVDSSFTHPDFGIIRRAWEMFADLLVADDGHPQMGKELKDHLVKSGFENIRVTGSFDMYSTPSDVTFIYEFANRWFLSPEIVEAAIKYGATSRELCDAARAAYDRWKDHAGALCALAFGEVVANKP